MPEALRIDGLRKEYPRRGAPPFVAVQDVTFQVEQGQIVGLLGPNGAGKTTTLKCVLGLIEPTAGEIHLFGHDARRERRQAAAKVAAVLEGSRNVFWRMSVRENLDYFALIRGLSPRAVRPRREQLIEAFGLGPHADKEAHALSAGLRQRLATACAVIQQAPLLLLDEPTLGLDVESAAALEELLRELVAREGITILVTSHELEMIERVAERVIIIQSGEIVVDASVRELLGLFRSRRYRCVLTLPSARVPAPVAGPGGALPAALEAALAAPARRDGDRWTLEFELDDAGRLFDYLDLVRQGGFLIESITRDQPDLRQAYLRFVQGDSGAHEALGGARRVAADSSGGPPGSSAKAEGAEADG